MDDDTAINFSGGLVFKYSTQDERRSWNVRVELLELVFQIRFLLILHLSIWKVEIWYHGGFSCLDGIDNETPANRRAFWVSSLSQVYYGVTPNNNETPANHAFVPSWVFLRLRCFYFYSFDNVDNGIEVNAQKRTPTVHFYSVFNTHMSFFIYTVLYFFTLNDVKTILKQEALEKTSIVHFYLRWTRCRSLFQILRLGFLFSVPLFTLYIEGIQDCMRE